MVGTFPIGRLFDNAVGECNAVRSRLLHALGTTVAQLFESGAELLGHGVIDDRVDGAVQVDAEAAEEQEPGVQVGLVQEGVDHH